MAADGHTEVWLSVLNGVATMLIFQKSSETKFWARNDDKYIHLDTDPLLAKRRFWIYFTRSYSALTPSKKVQSTLIGSPLCAFQCTNVRRLTVAKRPHDCSYSTYARSASAVTTIEEANVNSCLRSLYAIARPYVCRLSPVACRLSSVPCTLLRRLKFRSLCHLIRWPSADIQVKFYGVVPGELLLRGS